jgi:hypothetical protein
MNQLLKPKEAAEFLKISRWMLDELRIQGKLPTHCYMVMNATGKGKRMTIRYKTDELMAWQGQAC